MRDRYEAESVVWLTLEKGNWPSLAGACARIAKLTENELLANTEFLAVAERTGGYGSPGYPTGQVEFDYFRRNLTERDFPELLRALTGDAPAGVECEQSYNDIMVKVEVRDDRGNPYWALRRLIAVGALYGDVREPIDWIALLPESERGLTEWFLSRAAIEAVEKGETDKLAFEVGQRRALAAFHASPQRRAEFDLEQGLVPIEHLLVMDPQETGFRMTLNDMGYERFVRAFHGRDRGTVARARELLIKDEKGLERFDDLIEEPRTGKGWRDCRGLDPDDALVQLRALISYWLPVFDHSSD